MPNQNYCLVCSIVDYLYRAGYFFFHLLFDFRMECLETQCKYLLHFFFLVCFRCAADKVNSSSNCVYVVFSCKNSMLNYQNKIFEEKKR